jgi:hypothetical protein
VQDATGGRSITFGSDYVLPTGWAPTTTPNKRATINFRGANGKWYPTGFVDDA